MARLRLKLEITQCFQAGPPHVSWASNVKGPIAPSEIPHAGRKSALTGRGRSAHKQQTISEVTKVLSPNKRGQSESRAPPAVSYAALARTLTTVARCSLPPLVIIDAAKAYLPDGLDKDEFITRVLEAIDNPRINAALAAHGHPVAG
jgi:hypothetical protein